VAGGSGEGGGPALARTTAAPEIASAYGPYLVEFRRRIQAGLRYPPAARRRGLAGTAEIDVLVDARGRIERVEIHRSSTHAALDEAALDAVKRATPPPLPPGAPARPLRLRLPVVFELR
jgi:protein TonB